ncbi:MAG: hypothetical protein IPQ07_14615 [Myxococcales bacterium]|nr:hypothetical protein [Myxococcales bacterium]
MPSAAFAADNAGAAGFAGRLGGSATAGDEERGDPEALHDRHDHGAILATSRVEDRVADSARDELDRHGREQEARDPPANARNTGFGRYLSAPPAPRIRSHATTQVIVTARNTGRA